MAVQSVTIPTGESREHKPCPCGCAPCDGTCCHLDCLVQPRFFCGQLLTDQDLNTLLGWAQDKFRLDRYTDGWGVVCGLEVRCDAEGGWVTVEPGYAISCCGDDIVVCEQDRLDLRDYCTREKDPCADLEEQPEDRGEISFAGCRFRAADVRVLDLHIAYDEKLESPQTTLGRSACHEVAECEYSRTREDFKLVPRPAYHGSDPVAAAANAWRREYDGCMEVIDRFRKAFPDRSDIGPEMARSMRTWFTNWLDDRPLHQFCFLHDCLCDGEMFDLTKEEDLVKILFWIVQDCRNAFLDCHCHSCGEDESSVPLARIWLHVPENGREQTCRVLHIDAYPPYRRPLSRECWPAPLGKVNLGRVIWHRADEACNILADLGVVVKDPERLTLPGTVDDLYDALDCDPFAGCNESVVLQTVADVLNRSAAAETKMSRRLSERVVGFCGGDTPPGRPGIRVEKTAREKEARPGGVVTYTFGVWNVGNQPLTVTVEDDQLGTIAEEEKIAPGDRRSYSRRMEIPPDPEYARLQNTVKAVGVAPDGREVVASDSHVLPVVEPAPIALLLTKRAPEKARPGAQIEYVILLENQGELPLKVRVSDEMLDLEETVWLEEGAREILRAKYEIPENAEGRLRNTASATGVANDGRSTGATDTAVVAIERLAVEVLLESSVEPEAVEEMGQPATVHFRVTNAGEAPMRIEELRDERFGLLANDIVLRPGQVEQFSRQWQVTDEMAGHATLRAASDDAREVATETSWSVGLRHDDFEKIGGIGTGRKEALYKAGIRRFDQFAEADHDTLREVIRYVSDETLEKWRAEAQALAEGED